MTFKEPVDQMARWLEILSQFDFKIEHRAGKNHSNADALSRLPCDPDDCPCYDSKTILTSLPCGGCEKCVAKNELWSNFNEIDDVVPLSARRMDVTADGRAGIAMPPDPHSDAEPRSCALERKVSTRSSMMAESPANPQLSPHGGKGKRDIPGPETEIGAADHGVHAPAEESTP